MEGSPTILFFPYESRGDNLKIVSQKCLLLGGSEPNEANFKVSNCICLPIPRINFVISGFVDFLNNSKMGELMKVNEMFRKSTKHEITKFIHETGKQMQSLTWQ